MLVLWEQDRQGNGQVDRQMDRQSGTANSNTPSTLFTEKETTEAVIGNTALKLLPFWFWFLRI